MNNNQHTFIKLHLKAQFLETSFLFLTQAESFENFDEHNDTGYC